MDSAQLALLDLLGENKTYQETLRSHPSILAIGKGLPTQIRRLRQLIVDALVASRQGNSIRKDILRQLMEAQVLIDHDQVDFALRILRKTAKKAQQFGYFHLGLEALDAIDRLPGSAEIVSPEDRHDLRIQARSLEMVRDLSRELLLLLRKEIRPRDGDTMWKVSEIEANAAVEAAIREGASPHPAYRNGYPGACWDRSPPRPAGFEAL